MFRGGEAWLDPGTLPWPEKNLKKNWCYFNYYLQDLCSLKPEVVSNHVISLTGVIKAK
jgi:hypothetical protein